MNSAAAAQNFGWQPQTIKVAGYRPLDRQQHYSDHRFNDRPRPDLLACWGQNNICLFSMPSGTNFGPATWCHSNFPDRHAFRGSYGGYAFPLWDRRAGPNAHNLSPDLIAGLSAAYGAKVSPEQVFDGMLCLLSAKSYSLTFAEDLEDVFPHIPFPADREVFFEASNLGAEIRAVETFTRAPKAEFAPAGLCRFATPPKGKIMVPHYEDGAFDFCENGAGHASGIPSEIWHYSVSGYELLPRWINGRVGLEVDLALANELRDICGRIAELIDLSAKADKILGKSLKKVLSRAAAGLGPVSEE